MQKLVWQNANGVELDLTSGNYGITEWEGFSNASLNIQSQQVPFQDGGVFLDALIEQRELSVTLAMQDNNNLELRYQNRRELISALNPKLGEGYLIYTNDFISKRIKCVPQIPLFETHNSDTAGTPKASLSWTACSPYWEDLEETSIELPMGQEVTIENQGDTPTQIQVDIETESNNPIIVNRTTGKKIELNAELGSRVIINTEQGKKSVEAYEQIFNWKQGGQYCYCAYGNGKYMYASTDTTYGIVCEDIMTGELQGFYVPSNTIIDLIFVNNLWVILTNNVASNIWISRDNGQNWESYNKRQIIQQGIHLEIKSIKYYNGKYIAITKVDNTDSYISTSTDFENWQSIKQEGLLLNCICYATEDKTYIAGGDNGVLLKSSDLETWTQLTSGTARNINDIIYTGTFVAVTSYREVIYSIDGTSWTIVNIPENVAQQIYKICFGNGLYVINMNGNVIYVSTDLINWTRLRNDDGSGVNSKGIVYGGGNFVLVSYNNMAIEKSSDGINWVTAYDWETSYYDIACTNEKIVIITANTIYVSTDEGTTWGEQTGFTGLLSILYAKGLYIIIGEDGLILTSPNATDWTQRTSGVSYDLGKIRYFEETETIIIINNTGGRILHSTDGINWTKETIDYSADIRDMTFGGGKYITLGKSGNAVNIYYSLEQDGLDQWTAVATGFSSNYAITSIVYNKIFIAFGNNMIYYSQNGLNWTFYIRLGLVASHAVVIRNTVYVLSPRGLYVMSSYYARGLQLPVINMYGIAGYNNNIIAVGEKATIIKTKIHRTNLINSATQETDMNLGLKQGENKILFFADATDKTAIITYRQKYIGV